MQEQAPARGTRGLTLEQLKASIKVNLSHLLAATNLEAFDEDVRDNWPLVRASVLNYGVPPLIGYSRDTAGRTGSRRIRPKTAEELRMLIVEAIRNFEPRIDPDSVEVRRSNEASGDEVLALEIKALVVGAPYEEIVIFTRYENDGDRLTITESKNA